MGRCFSEPPRPDELRAEGHRIPTASGPGGPSLLDNPIGITLIEDELGGFGGFPDSLFLIGMGGDKYAANNATMPDGSQLDGLACFPSPDDATTYMGLLAGLTGEIVSKSFEEAREIAKSKPKLNCLLLFVAGHIVEVHFVR